MSTGREGTLDLCWLDSRISLLASIVLIIVLGAFDTDSSSSIADIACIMIILMIAIKIRGVSYRSDVSNRSYAVWCSVMSHADV